nr:ribonuclease H-like domain-containing protein [Tanacetum cinerariifolium]
MPDRRNLRSTALTPIPTFSTFGNKKTINSINSSLSLSHLGVKLLGVGNKMHKAFPLPVIEFPLAEEVPTASEESCHCQKKRKATAVKIALLLKSRRNCQSKSDDSYAKRKNDVKARTTLPLSLPDEHQLRFSKYKTTQELWAAILKTFGGNEATKKTKKNFLKQQYGNFKAKGIETLEQTFNRLQVIDINQIDEDDMEEMDIKWSMALLGMRSQDRGRRDNYRQGSKVKEHAPKALMEINGVGWDWSYMANDEENHALVAKKEAPIEFALMANTSAESKDLSWTGLPEFKDDTVTDYSRPAPTVESSPDDAQNRNSSVTKEASPSTISPISFIKLVKANDSPSKSKIDKDEKAKKSSVKKRMKKGTSRSQNNTHKSFTPRPAVYKPYRPPMRPMRSNMNDARPKPAHSYTNKPFQRTSAVRSQYRAPWVPTVNRKFPPVNRKFYTVSRKFSTVNRKFPTANRKFPTGGTKFHTADMGKKGKAIKPLACWFWKPSQNLSNKGPNNNSGSSQNNINDKGYWDSGCSRHMTGNISYLSDFKPFNGGYVSFGQGGCKITGKETIKTGKLKFENVYFVKDLKYNLFSVLQICDNKNSVLFTDSECIVLGRDFKLLDDANILLRAPRQHNMYSIDLNNIVPHKDLTCLVAKASADECMIWHRRLGHLNFKTMNKLVRHNLVRGLPTKCFENDHTCTACLKGKQHKASWKFEEKGDKGYFIGYSMSSKAFRVFNKRTRKVEENLHVEFLENKAIKKGAGPNWLFDIDSLTKSMNYVPMDACTNSTNLSGTKDAASQEPQDDYSVDVPESSGISNPTATSTNPPADQLETLIVETPIPTVSSSVPTACFTDSPEPSNDARLISKRVANQVETPSLDNILTLANRFEDILVVTTNSYESNGVEADVSNIETTITASPTPTLRIHKDHPKSQIISHVDTLIQTRNKFKEISNALQDPSWAEAMQEELLQFKIQNVWTWVDCPKGVRPIGTKWVLKNKKDERGIVIRNKARLVAQGHTQEERIEYDEVFAPVARIEAIRLFLAYASFMRFTVYQMDVKSAFLYGTINEEVHQVTPKECHLHAVKRIFRYLKGHPKLGLWYPKESPFDLVAYSDSDYGGATQDRKSTTRGCQFLGRRLISWQCKKKTIVATSTTEAKYVATASCCGQVLWIQNQLLDYGLSMPCEALSKEISSSILCFLRLIPLVSKGYVTMKACCKIC